MRQSADLRLARRSLADQVADALGDLILTEGLREGDALPSVAELSERFAVSRTVIREALATLAGGGVLNRSQGRESVVATPGADDLSRVLRFRVQPDDVTVGNILDVRVALEVLAARSAAANATPEQVEALWGHLDALASAGREADYHAADIALHQGIASAGANPLIPLILGALTEFLHDVRVKATKARKARGETLDAVIEEHRRIVDAVASGDVDLAGEAMRFHLASTRAELG